MKKLIFISLAAAASLAVAGPVLAQPYQGTATYDQAQYGGISHRVDYLSTRVDADQSNGQLDWRQANQLKDQLSRIRDREQQYLAQDNGPLTEWQRDRLQGWLDNIAGQLRAIDR
jgi:hypothetical protein